MVGAGLCNTIGIERETPVTKETRVTHHELQQIIKAEKYSVVIEKCVGRYPTEQVLKKLVGMIANDLIKEDIKN